MMIQRTLAASAALLLSICIFAAGRQHKKAEEPKNQIQPLPPEPPMALMVDTSSLDFHMSPLLKTGGLAAQIKLSLNNLIRDTHGETIVKLRAFVAGTGDARRVRALVTDLFTEHKLPLPVLSILQVGALGQDSAQIVIEAVVSTPRTLNPSGLAFFSGQHGPALGAALEKLKSDAGVAGVDATRVLTTTCFTSHIDSFDLDSAAVRKLFPNTEVNLVQAVRDPLSDATSCEAIAQLSAPPEAGPVIVFENARATLVHSPQLVFTGLQLTFGNYLDDAQVAFTRLQRTAAALDGVETPVEVTAFALDSYAASALRKTVSFAPGVFSILRIEGLPAIDATSGMEAVLAPGIRNPVVRKASDATITR